MNMKRISIAFIAAAAAALMAGCGKVPTTGINESQKREWDAWLSVQQKEHPEYLWKKTNLGSYILEDDNAGTTYLAKAEEAPFILVEFTERELDGTVLSSTSESLAKQLGTYDERYYYGPLIWHRGSESFSSGLNEILSNIKLGQHIKAAMPGWIQSSERFDTEEEYLAKCEGTGGIIEMKVHKGFKNLLDAEADSLCRYLNKKYGSNLEPKDSVSYGCYYVQLAPPTSTEEIADGERQYINYTGYNLAGQAFDTTIKDTAKVYGLFDSSANYKQVLINWATDYKNMTMGDDEGELITGFKACLIKMNKHEKGVGGFISELGYQDQAKNGMIPAYSPLVFEFEMTDSPE